MRSTSPAKTPLGHWLCLCYYDPEEERAPTEGDESDRLYGMASVAARAMEVFGSREEGALWLRSPNHALDREIPLTLLDTEVGSRQVDEILGRIEYGLSS